MKFNGNNGKAMPSGGVDTLIGKHTEVQGDLQFSGGLHIDGRVRGKVIAEAGAGAALSLGESGVIEGNVRVPIIMLNGTVVGDVYASDRLTVAERARISGNVHYRVIEIASGAQINGQLLHEDAPVAGQAAASSGLSGDELSEARRLRNAGQG